MAKKENTGKVVTKVVRLSYAHLKEPTAFEEGQEKKFNATLLIEPDSETDYLIQDVIEAEYKANKESKFKGLPLSSPKIWNPLRDGNEWLDEHPDADEFADMLFLKASSKSRPVLFDEDGVEVDFDNYDLFYSGCYVRAVMVVYSFNKNGKRGFGFFLNSLKFIKDGDRLGGMSASADDYEDDEPVRRKSKSRDAEEEAPARGRGVDFNKRRGFQDPRPSRNERPVRRRRDDDEDDDLAG